MTKISKNILRISLIIIAIILVYIVSIFFVPNFKNDTKEKQYLYIRENATFDDVLGQLTQKKLIKNNSLFKQAASLLNYTNYIKQGRYLVKNGTNNFNLIRRLRSGRQTPVQLTFNNIRTKYQLASVLGKQLQPDSLKFIQLMNDSAYLAQYNLNPQTATSIFIPNTYEVYWTTNENKVFEKMYREYEKFWTRERKEKAAEIPLSQSEVITLASIVDSETNSFKEKPVIAGLYINRLKKGMYLQADPTVIFAAGDFTIKRVTNTYTAIDSPYNTYRYKGLPPGPICLANPKTIDAVLNYDRNDYIFMCAKETLNGEHNFAANWAEHRINALKYQQALNERGIR